MTISALTEERAKRFAEELEAVAGQYWCEVGKDVALLMSTTQHKMPSDPTTGKKP
jgi:hypothetical protein